MTQGWKDSATLKAIAIELVMLKRRQHELINLFAQNYEAETGREFKEWVLKYFIADFLPKDDQDHIFAQIKQLGLSTRVQHILRRGVTSGVFLTFADIVLWSQTENIHITAQLRNCGQKAFEELRRALIEHGYLEA